MNATKLVGMLLIAAMVVAAAACAGGTTPTATPPTQQQATPTQQVAPTATPTTSGPAAVSGGQFHSIPVPDEAKQAHAVAWQMPGGQAQGGYENMEWRAYQTGLSLDKLKSFYKSEMSRHGWTQTMWMEGSGQQGEMAWGLYSKGDQDETATVCLVPEENDFNLVLMWVGNKK